MTLAGGSPRSPAIITLTTDFGRRDPYVAEMKAVILGITRAVHLVDITHDVRPHDVMEGALALEGAVPHFPPGTVHLAVIDPGVGSARRGLAVAAGAGLFVGPDNGLFTPFVAQEGWRAVEPRAARFRRAAVSRTFHGRDVFAPAAAHLARGIALGRLGPPVLDPVRLAWPGARVASGELVGVVVHVDRFGNLVTSIAASAVEALGPGAAVRVAGRALRLVGTYADLAPGEAGALTGSGNRLEVAVREGSAQAALRAGPGTAVVVRTPGRLSRRSP